MALGNPRIVALARIIEFSECLIAQFECWNPCEVSYASAVCPVPYVSLEQESPLVLVFN